jgi:hypothetical protein
MLLPLVVVAALASGCFDDDTAGSDGMAGSSIAPHGEAAISLRITYHRHLDRRHFHGDVVVGDPILLRCDPPATGSEIGDAGADGAVDDARSACLALRSFPRRYFGTPTWTCRYTHAWVTVQGLFEGSSVRRRYDLCEYPQARAWTDLGGTTLRASVPAGSPEASTGQSGGASAP